MAFFFSRLSLLFFFWFFGSRDQFYFEENAWASSALIKKRRGSRGKQWSWHLRHYFFLSCKNEKWWCFQLCFTERPNLAGMNMGGPQMGMNRGMGAGMGNANVGGPGFGMGRGKLHLVIIYFLIITMFCLIIFMFQRIVFSQSQWGAKTNQKKKWIVTFHV